MPRQPRLILPDLPVHIIHRGNNRLDCFHEDQDHLVYLSLLIQASRKAMCAVHAYCLMSNHIHLLLTAPTPEGCAAFMHGVAHRYAYYYNRKYERTGTLWEGRFRSSVVESSEYVLACYRYIELNPVRAGMVGEPGSYRWSSYSANCGATQDALVTPHAELMALSHSAYAGWVAEGVDDRSLGEIRDALNGGYPFASDSFKSAVHASTGKKTTPGRPGRRAKAPAEEESVAVPDLFSAGAAS